jgi:hypothetical protein
MLEITYNNLKKNVFDVFGNSLDIFVYGSIKSFDNKDEKISNEFCENLLKPKKYILTPDLPLSKSSNILVKEFGKGKERYLQMIYALYKCNELISEYEKENNFKYDYKLRLRVDTMFLKPLSKFEPVNAIIMPDFHNERTTCAKKGKYNDGICIHDRFAYGPSDKMNILLDQYIHLPRNDEDLLNYTHAEHLLYHYLKRYRLSWDENTIIRDPNIVFVRIRKENNKFIICPTDCGDTNNKNDGGIDCTKYLKNWKKTGLSELK